MAPNRKRKAQTQQSNEENETCNNEDEVDDILSGEISLYMPKMPRDSENIINIAKNNPNLNPEQICLLFIEVAKRADHNLEFDLSHWLIKYATYRAEPNFSQIALLIIHAAQIYGRKVDLVYDFICRLNSVTGKVIGLCEDTRREAAEIEKAIENGELPKKVRKIRKKKEAIDKENIDPFEMFGGNMKPVPITQTKESLREKVVLEEKDKESDTNRKSLSICNRLRRKIMIMKMLKQLRKRIRSKRPIFKCEFPVPSDNHEILNYANEEITDLDDEIPAGTRRDFFSFMGMICLNNHTLHLVHKFNKLDENYNRQNNSNAGATLLPPKYLEKNYNVKLRNPKHYYVELHKEIEVWKKLGPARHEERLKRCILIAYYVAAEIMNNADIDPTDITISQCDSIINKLSPLKSLIDNNFNCDSCESTDMGDLPLFSDSGIGSSILSQTMETSVNNSQNDIMSQIVNSELRISVDEGIGSGRASPNLPKLSDLNPLERSLLFPSVQLVDVCDPLNSNKKNQMQQNVWLISRGGLIKPLDVPNEVPLELNIFKFPEPKLRRKCDFSLPKSYNVMKKIKLGQKLTLKDLHPDFVRLRDIVLEANDRCTSPELDDQGFIGFDDDVLSSPLLLLRQNKNLRTVSRDSGILDSTNLSQEEIREQQLLQTIHNSNMLEKELMDSGINNTTTNILNSTAQSTENNISLPDVSVIQDQSTINESTAENFNNSSDHYEDPTNDYDDFNLLDTFDEDNDAAERIREWNLHLAPILRESKARSYFDIHAYGQKIVASFPESVNSSTKPVISFAELVPETEKNFTARYFLSVLQLTNMENLELIVPENKTRHDLVDASQLKIKLLNKELRAEAMDEAQKFEIYEPAKKMSKLSNSDTSTPLQQIMKRCGQKEKLSPFKKPNQQHYLNKNITPKKPKKIPFSNLQTNNSISQTLTPLNRGLGDNSDYKKKNLMRNSDPDWDMSGKITPSTSSDNSRNHPYKSPTHKDNKKKHVSNDNSFDSITIVQNVNNEMHILADSYFDNSFESIPSTSRGIVRSYNNKKKNKSSPPRNLSYDTNKDLSDFDSIFSDS